MRVDPISNVSGPENTRSANPEPKTRTPQEQADVAESVKLLQALKEVPATRADKIAQAKALIQDPSYPNDSILRQVANVLTDHLKPGHPSK